MVHIPDDRIKVCEAVIAIPTASLRDLRALIIKEITDQIGAEIANKLREYNKFTVTTDGDDTIFHCSLEVIVPSLHAAMAIS